MTAAACAAPAAACVARRGTRWRRPGSAADSVASTDRPAAARVERRCRGCRAFKRALPVSADWVVAQPQGGKGAGGTPGSSGGRRALPGCWAIPEGDAAQAASGAGPAAGPASEAGHRLRDAGAPTCSGSACIGVWARGACTAALPVCGRAGGGGGAEFRTPSGGRGAAQAPPVAVRAPHLHSRRHTVEAGRRAGRCNQPASYVLLLHSPGAAQALDAPAPLRADLGSARERLEAAGRRAGARHEGRAGNAHAIVCAPRRSNCRTICQLAAFDWPSGSPAPPRHSRSLTALLAQQPHYSGSCRRSRAAVGQPAELQQRLQARPPPRGAAHTHAAARCRPRSRRPHSPGRLRLNPGGAAAARR